MAEISAVCLTTANTGLNRCRYRGDDGLQRWVGLGVIADNLINVGLAIGKQSAK